MIDIAELEKLARVATPGPWFPCGARYTMISRELNDQEIEDIAEVCNHFRDVQQVEINKNFIASCDPQTILALCEEIKSLLECKREALEIAKYVLALSPANDEAQKFLEKYKERE